MKQKFHLAAIVGIALAAAVVFALHGVDASAAASFDLAGLSAAGLAFGGMTWQPAQLDPYQGSLTGGGRIVNTVPNGYRYHMLRIRYVSTLAGGTAQTVDSTVMSAELSRIDLKVGTKVQRTYTGETLIMLLKFVGGTIQNNFLEIPFYEYDRNTVNGSEALAWGTDDLPNPAVRIETTIAASKYPTVFEVHAERDDANLPLGAIVKIKETTFNVSAAGDFTYNPDYSSGDKLRRLHIKDSGQISAVLVKANNREEVYVTSAVNTQRLKQATPAFVPQTNWFHLVFDVDHGVFSNLDTVRMGKDGTARLLANLAMKFTFGASGNYTVVEEWIGQRD